MACRMYSCRNTAPTCAFQKFGCMPDTPGMARVATAYPDALSCPTWLTSSSGSGATWTVLPERSASTGRWSS